MENAPLLDPKTLSRIATLQLRARRVVEGVLTGLHRSPHQGQAVEFAEHKEYAPGDEIRHIDWRAYARVDKYYVKKYELETNLPIPPEIQAAFAQEELPKLMAKIRDRAEE